ncbi:MAG: YkvA family protein [Myxococcota bacterium]
MNKSSTRLGAKAIAYFRDPAVSVWKKLVGAAALAYLVMPLDFIPDAPVIGWLDDLGVLSAAAWFMVRQFNKHAASVESRHQTHERLP